MNKEQLLECAYRLGIRGLTTENTNGMIMSKIAEVLGKPAIQEDGEEVSESLLNTIITAGPDTVAKESGPVLHRAQNIPNLTPTGVWHGKRARIKRPKTGTNDMNGAIFNWNGLICIIPIDVEVDIAWPIYEAIQLCNGMRMKIRQEEDPRDAAKVQNIKEIEYYRKYPYEFIGVTPGTEKLPESPWEYTLDMYVDHFPGFTIRMWRQLCILWEITNEVAGVRPGMKPRDEIRQRREAIHFDRNLPLSEDIALRMRVRNEKRADIHMLPKELAA